MRKSLLVFLSLFFFSANSANSEVIDIRSTEKTFGEWKVFCEIDDMMSNAHCKIAAKFFDKASVITIQPTLKSASQFFMIIPQIEIGGFVAARVEKNDLILSSNIAKKDFGLIPFSNTQKDLIFAQMKEGNFLFLRFKIQNLEKEVTVKLDLNDFRSALEYYNKLTFNTN